MFMRLSIITGICHASFDRMAPGNIDADQSPRPAPHNCHNMLASRASEHEWPMSKRSHFPALDALRGLAALVIVLFHMGHWLGLKGVVPNSALAVDFFFCLSGYVLALSYGARLDSGDWSAGRFMKVRLIRLMPVIVLATAISAAYLAARMVAHLQPADWMLLATATLFGLLTLPLLNMPHSIGGPQVFPLNGPQYSLFLELAINLLWAAIPAVRRTPVTVALILLAFAGFLVFGFGGDTSKSFWAGFPRITASFLMGTLVFRFQDRVVTRWSGALFLLMLVAMFGLMAYPDRLPLAIRILFVFVGAPATVLLGARVVTPDWLIKPCLFLGTISYPVYAIHYPVFVWINAAVQVVAKARLPLVEVPLIIVASIVASVLVVRFYDLPVRSWLSRARGGALHPAKPADAGA